MMGLSVNRDLTIILTLKDRSPFTYRWMHWMRQEKCPFKILIADGGKDPQVQKYLEDKSNNPELDYEYIRYPHDEDLRSFFAKLSDVASRVKTKFVISADNDDFFLIEALEKNLEFIHEHPQYTTVASPHLRLTIHRPSICTDDLVYAGGYPLKIKRLPEIKDGDLLDGSARVRLRAMIKHFYSGSVYYAIHLTEHVQEIFRNLRDMDFSQLLFHEWYVLYSHAIRGKMYLDYSAPYLMRQENTSQTAVPTYETENHGIITLMPEWSESLYKMIDRLYEEISGNEDVGTKQDFYTFFRSSFVEHMTSFMEFRGVANKLRKFPRTFKLSRFIYRKMYKRADILRSPRLSKFAIKKNPALAKLTQFLQSAPQ